MADGPPPALRAAGEVGPEGIGAGCGQAGDGEAKNEVSEQVERACTLGWAYRDAEAAAEAAALKLRNTKAAGSESLLDGLHEQVRRTRSTWTACALAARAAADAARGAQEALDCFERGEPWRRRTGEENGLFLLDLQDMLDARRRERKDEPA